MITSMIIAVLQAAPAPVPVAAPMPLPGWMAGCWIAEGEESQTEECWTVPRGSMMLGSGHTFTGPTTRWFEHMRIVQEGGTLMYIAQPGGASQTRFEMTEPPTHARTQTRSVRFENSRNDYPQLIIYSMQADGSMTAEISQADGTRPQRWTFRRSGSGS